MVDRSPGRTARSRRRRAALHAQLQLEDAGRESDRHLPSDGGARVLGRHRDRSLEDGAGRHAQADGGRDLRAVHVAATSSSRRWASASGTTATATPACITRSIPTIPRSPAISSKMVAAYGEARAKAILDENRHNTVYFPNLMVKGPIQTAAPVQADRGRPHAGRMLDLPAGRRARYAARAHADVQPADQRADLGRRSRRSRNVRARRRKGCTSTATRGSTCSGSTTRQKREQATPSPTARPNGRCATSSAPGPNS